MATASESNERTQTNPIPGWAAEIQDVEYLSAADNSLQRTLFFQPKTEAPVPLLVALHTWSADYLQKETGYGDWCIERGWAFLHPNFRGPNDKLSACGSELVVQDILSAVEFARQNANIDPERIYLIGGSGGGYASMLLAGRAPHIWAGVSAWCGIFDLKAWHAESRQRGAGYADMIEKSCGGPPEASPEEYRKRSASVWLGNAVNVPVDLSTGIYDGHRGSVPVSHSLNAFNALAALEDRFTPEEIRFITERAEIPSALQQEITDPAYGERTVLLRRTSGKVRLTLFDGGHDIIREAGMGWLEKQRKGQPPVWSVGDGAAANSGVAEIGG